MIITYSSIDGFRVSRRFKTLAGARRFAHNWIGATPEIGGSYAVAGDGVGKVTWRDCTARDLFPACYRSEAPAEPDPRVSFNAATGERLSRDECAELDDFPF